MPYKSEAQRRFFNSPAGKKKLGKEEVEKWNEESEGHRNLPERASDVKKIIDKALRSIDRTKVEIYNEGEHTIFERWVVVDIESGRKLGEFKKEKEAIDWCKKQGYDL